MLEIEKINGLIDEADAEIAKHFEKRMDAVKMLVEYKKTHGIPVEDFDQDAIINRKSKLIKNSDYRSYYVNFLREALNESKQMQHRLLDGMIVAFSGVEGAFANIAAKRIFPDATCVPCADFKSAYNSVVNGECDCAVLPIENNYNGDVSQVIDLAFFGSLYINGIYEIEIIQNLLAVKGTTMDEVKTVISHPQALGQCADYIEEHKFNVQEAVNTAVAVKTVAESGRHDIAAIGSSEAAEKYGLKKLESHINQSSSNATRFAVFSRVPKIEKDKDELFIMLFTVNNTAGSLGKAISVIGEYGFNLKALKSRPTKDLVWDYYFYVEGEGNINGEQGKKMLDELKKCCSNLKVVGSFAKEVKI